MRVTNKLMADKVNYQLARQTELMTRTQEKIITGKRINRASDDPSGMSSVLSYRSTLSGLEQFTENITKGKLHIDSVDSVLQTTTDLLREAKAIAFDPAPDRRAELAAEVGVIRQQLLDMANYKIDGKYAFSGDTTNTTPYNSTTWTYNGDGGTKDMIVGKNMNTSVTADGRQIFGPDGDNMFDILNDLESGLALDDPVAIKSQISRIDAAVDRITSVRAKNAGVNKRLDAAENHYAYYKNSVEGMLSKTEDADVAQAIINFKVQQTTYESTLATSSMILQKSLIDFLR
jgi:flagellar hook-associated protein 3 FlgL